MDGWIKLHRQTIDSRVFVNDGLLKVWVWCLLKANHSQQWVDIKTGRGTTEVKVLPGQFVFGRKTAAKSLKMKPDTVYSRMKKLEKMENINMQNNTHYSIISIVNWSSYQNISSDSQQQSQHPTNTQIPTNQQPNNTDKNEENENKEILQEKEFNSFWELFQKKEDRKKCATKWKNISKKDKELIFKTVSAYVESTPDKQYRKNPLTWLNGECWNNDYSEDKTQKMPRF